MGRESTGRVRALVGLCLLLLLATARAEPVTAFDHSEWHGLLQRHAHWIRAGHASTLDYAGMQADSARLQAYLTALSAVPVARFDAWPRDAQLAFLINAYNAFTVQRILSRYPDLASIKDLGSFLQSPWKKAFIPLLGETRSLDDIEHGLIRGSGRYQDPRIHFAVNCASIGCPALRPEAYVAERLDQQLDDQASRFLGDRTRNGLKDGVLEVSSIFKWYRDDFEQGFRGDRTLEEYLARHGDALGLTAAQVADVRAEALSIEFGDYDWRLNDSKP